jgi:chromosome partitioning protein
MTDNNRQDRSRPDQKGPQEPPLPPADQEQSAIKHRTPWNTFAARVISLVSRKGGVGKTTSAVNLGAALALSGHSVLVVSIDPQCGVSRTLGYGQTELKSGLLEIFTGSQSLTNLVHTTPLKDLYFVSPNIWSLDEEESYLDLMEGEVDTFIHEIDRARNLFDTIFIDCPPNLGPTTRAALLASDSYLVPIQAEELCRDSLERLLTFIQSFSEDALAETTSSMGSATSSGIQLEGMFLTMVNERTRMGRHVSAKVTEAYGDILFDSAIPRTVRLTEMAVRGKPVVIYDRKSPGSRAYFNLADEILERFQRQNGNQAGILRGTNNGFPTLEHLLGTGSADPRQPVADSTTSTPEPEPGLTADLDRLLGDLKSREAEGEDANTAAESTETPELVSLDEVLAEEERADDDSEWGESSWNASHDGQRRPN